MNGSDTLNHIKKEGDSIHMKPVRSHLSFLAHWSKRTLKIKTGKHKTTEWESFHKPHNVLRNRG